ncbi:glucose 1,6-bisphosphate synthase [Drosophila grimshawi]|uniref:glucose 1,6-bisphosphate synthase n=1 Tax=Drosophila grimshawi TaxID=7222 RepID=UPI001C932462|nr:glucose 1,6-bisphosphate synthase [Drosophila grimshawi]
MLAPKLPVTPAELLSTLELSGSPDLDQQITNWIMWDRNEATLKQVVEAVSKKDWEALRIRLCNSLSFGTCGMTSVMRAGFDSINDLVTIEFAQGLSNYLTELYPSVQKRESQGVVIGFDVRYNGKRFAQLIATVLLNSRFRVYLFNRMVPTPFISFSVLHLKCLAGIEVTASHSAKIENGFKVFWSNGAHVLIPHDKKLQTAMLNNMEPLNSSWDLSILDDHPLFHDPYREVYPAYFEQMKRLLPSTYLETNECSQLRFAYSPLHGVGFPYIREAFYQARLKPLIVVPQQKEPDPDFPTVKKPSPLENGSIDLAIKKAEEEHCTIVLINDPDVDRLAVAELDPRGRWKKFNGDELGALLGWWALESYKIRVAKPVVSNCVMIGSIGSSQILAAMARVEGFTFVETLVGFKWMCNKALELEALGRTVLFAFEQASGYMFSLNVPDKDAINATCQLATMACHLRSTRKLTLIEKLREIYDTYGYHVTLANTLTYDNIGKIAKVCDRMRNFKENTPGTYPQCILNGEFEVVSVRDLTLGVDTSYPDRKPRLPVSPNKQLITFTFNNGMTITFRGCGSEPTLRVFSEMFGLPEQKNWDDMNETLQRMTQAVIYEFVSQVDED